jgi:hypothetical protein
VNIELAISELDKFITMTVMRNGSGSSSGVSVITSRNYTAAPDSDVMKQAQVVEKILAIRAREELVRPEEVKVNLGGNAPEPLAAELHLWWIWSGASSLWQSGHEAEDAIKKLNAETQNKMGRRDVSETDLFKQAFTHRRTEGRQGPSSPHEG